MVSRAWVYTALQNQHGHPGRRKPRSGLIITWSPWRPSYVDELQKVLIKDFRNPPNFQSPYASHAPGPSRLSYSGRAGCASAGGSFFSWKDGGNSCSPGAVSSPGSGLRAHVHVQHC